MFSCSQGLPKSRLNEDGMYVNDMEWKRFKHWSYPHVSAVLELDLLPRSPVPKSTEPGKKESPYLPPFPIAKALIRSNEPME